MAVDGLVEQVAHEWRRSGRRVSVGGFSLEVADDAIHDGGLCENGDDLHFVPHLVQRSGSTSKTFRISRAQEARLGEDVAGVLSVSICDSSGGLAARSFCDRFLRVRLA